jgi:hypothetical protein
MAEGGDAADDQETIGKDMNTKPSSVPDFEAIPLNELNDWDADDVEYFSKI